MNNTHQTDNSGCFRIKAYGLKELGLLYFPDSSPSSASTQLKRWIHYSEELSDKLEKAGYFKGQRILTPRQVRIIVDFLGEP